MLESMLRRSALFSLLLLQACAGNGVRPLRPLELATAPYEDIISSSVTGSLMHEGGCLIFRDEETKAHYVPVWPVGSVFNGTSVIFHEPAKADQRIVIGEEFLMEGRPAEWAEIANDYYDRFQRQCGAEPFFVSAVRPAN